MPEDDAPHKAKDQWRDTRRHAGCILGCLAEPFVMVALVIASLLGAYTVGRKTERARAKTDKSDKEPPDA